MPGPGCPWVLQENTPHACRPACPHLKTGSASTKQIFLPGPASSDPKSPDASSAGPSPPSQLPWHRPGPGPSPAPSLVPSNPPAAQLAASVPSPVTVTVTGLPSPSPSSCFPVPPGGPVFDPETFNLWSPLPAWPFLVCGPNSVPSPHQGHDHSGCGCHSCRWLCSGHPRRRDGGGAPREQSAGPDLHFKATQRDPSPPALPGTRSKKDAGPVPALPVMLEGGWGFSLGTQVPPWRPMSPSGEEGGWVRRGTWALLIRGPPCLTPPSHLGLGSPQVLADPLAAAGAAWVVWLEGRSQRGHLLRSMAAPPCQAECCCFPALLKRAGDKEGPQGVGEVWAQVSGDHGGPGPLPAAPTPSQLTGSSLGGRQWPDVPPLSLLLATPASAGERAAWLRDTECLSCSAMWLWTPAIFYHYN